MKMADLGYGCVMHSTSMEEHYTFVEEHSTESTFMEMHSKNSMSVHAFFAILGQFRI